MNCRVKTLFVTLVRLTVLVLFLAVSLASAQPYAVINDSPKLSMYPEWLYSRMTATKGWIPSQDISAECKLSFSSPELVPAKCEAHYHLSYWDSFLSKIYVDFDVTDQTKFQRVQFEPQPGLKIRALLGLQTENQKIQKKPLVIVRMGIHGNIDEFLAERYLARIAYQDLGYHLMVIESLTSHGFLTINEKYSVGGIEEGLHTFYILNLITHAQVDWAKHISEIYLMGISLAGPGVFVTNYLDENSLVKGKRKKPDLKAIELFCPLVNFEETYKEHEKPGVFSAFVDIWNRRRLVAIRQKNKDFEDLPWWKTLIDLTPRFMPEVINSLNKTHGQPVLSLESFKKQFPEVQFPPEFIAHVAKSKTLYELNHFWEFYKNEKTPMHIYLTPNDPAVMNRLNAEMIRSGKQPGIFKNVKFTDLKGLHCALAAEYQWPFLVELVKRGFNSGY